MRKSTDSYKAIHNKYVTKGANLVLIFRSKKAQKQLAILNLTGLLFLLLNAPATAAGLDSYSMFSGVIRNDASQSYSTADTEEVGFVRGQYSTVSSLSSVMIAEAKKYIGTPYVFGSSNPEVGFDCSGFTLRLFEDIYDISLPHSASMQRALGESISPSEAIPGDLVVYSRKDGTNQYGHIGIYIGNDEIIHSGIGYPEGVSIRSINIGADWEYEFIRLKV